MKRTAWDCTCSIALLVVLSDGPQRASVYSRIGRQSLVYASNLPLLDASCREYFIQPRNFDALFILDVIRLSNFRFDWISMPRYAVWSTHSREYCGAAVGALLNVITSHLSMLNGIFPWSFLDPLIITFTKPWHQLYLYPPLITLLACNYMY